MIVLIKLTKVLCGGSLLAISYFLVFSKSWQSGLNMKGKVQGFIQGEGRGVQTPTQDLWGNPPLIFTNTGLSTCSYE